ncbi:MAG: bifunctional oligoribonuclease/PAP phosphatase NrnA [Clostridia bacterium]|nr:bifunctional oligoribonuclease/PAP phosphatase NrnA [Clostridia bacterium]MDE7328663.1 bifunctional oligoribonuclease/PAP phosphatase NrnA [Clostridia bacterium]
MYEDFIKAVDSSSTIAIISHINPDGDTCGSALALFRALSLYSKDKNIYLLCDGNIKGNLTTLKGSEFYNQAEPDKVELAIACDCADMDRLGKFTSLFNRAKISVDIDHHKTNDRYGKINIIEAGVSATCEVMYKVLKALDKRKPCFDDDVAKLLYSGLVTDSGGFSYSNVSTQTHLIASELIKYDFKASEVCERFLKKVSMNKFLLRMRVLSKAKFFENGKIGMIIFTQEDFAATGTTVESTEGAINYVRDIDGVEIAVSITQMPQDNNYKVSVRTSDNYDASRITMQFGGGGHKNAAGCRVSGFFEDVKDKVLKACVDEL